MIFTPKTAAIVLAGVALTATGATASPLASGDWMQIARMSDSDLGMFDGNGQLASTYSFGTYVSENQTDDFARVFDVFDNMQILFITGNGNVWAQSDYADLRFAIDASPTRNSITTENFTWDATSANASGQGANILSRNGPTEDPWISFSGDHFDGVNTTGLLWGEADWGSWGTTGHAALKNANGGVNVWVTVQPEISAVPVPAAGLLLLSGLGGIAAFKRRKPNAA